MRYMMVTKEYFYDGDYTRLFDGDIRDIEDFVRVLLRKYNEIRLYEDGTLYGVTTGRISECISLSEFCDPEEFDSISCHYGYKILN